MEKKIFGNIVDVIQQKIFSGKIIIKNGIIKEIKSTGKTNSTYIIPGLIDAHIHIESSMLTPGRFAQVAVRHGTVATVSDPHEIANVLGIKGIDYMMEDAGKVPVKFFFGAPSCVPATIYETAGAEINADRTAKLLKRKEIKYLSEMMNVPGVLNKDREVISKINCAKSCGKPIDGHAPGLSGKELQTYIDAGITTDHECMTVAEATEKIRKGMTVQIREGSAAKNFDELYTLIDRFPEKVMLCTDDIHPDDLLKGHINKLILRGLANGLNIFNLLCAASVNPVKHYGLDVGLLQTGDPADLVVIDSLEHFKVLETYIDGERVYADGHSKITYRPGSPVNNFIDRKISTGDLAVPVRKGSIRTIQAFDGELYTKEMIQQPTISKGKVIADPERDMAKIAVVNRYGESMPAVAFIHGFGIQYGAIGSSIAHDSHNIVALGHSDEDIACVINEIITRKGGIALCNKKGIASLGLEVGGLMTTKPPEETVKMYEHLNHTAKQMCSSMTAPFMTLSFMSLLVIPELKLSNHGLFDVNTFSITSLFVDNQ